MKRKIPRENSSRSKESNYITGRYVMVHRMHPLSHVVKVHAYLGSISFASLSLPVLSFVAPRFCPFLSHFHENAWEISAHGLPDRDKGFPPSLAGRPEPRSLGFVHEKLQGRW